MGPTQGRKHEFHHVEEKTEPTSVCGDTPGAGGTNNVWQVGSKIDHTEFSNANRAPRESRLQTSVERTRMKLRVHCCVEPLAKEGECAGGGSGWIRQELFLSLETKISVDCLLSSTMKAPFRTDFHN